jgi:NAD(P)-dependent dehydrogenase (short-subunit alcohol dehydrogenase family)
MSGQQKVAIVTGGSQGIGAALVEGFRRRDYVVVTVARSLQEGMTAGVLALRGDIAEPKTAERVVAEAVTRFGRVDTLVNNAGIFLAKPFTEYSREDFERKIGTNLSGFFYITQHAVRQMLLQGSGHVVSITTSLADRPTSLVPTALANLTKGGINSATKALALEYATKGIRVNAVSPGVIKTPMHQPETHEFLASLHPMNRLGEIADVVSATMFLEDASFVTGEILHIDGGQSAGA